MGNLSIRCCRQAGLGAGVAACPQRSSASMSFSWLFLGRLVSTRARFRFTNRGQHAVNSLCRSSIFQRTANYLLTVCLTPGGKATETLSIPIGTVMSRLSRARRTLRDHLGRELQSNKAVTEVARGINYGL